MFDLAKPKWIIQDGEHRLGRVVMHEDLADKDGPKPIGGGMWFFDKDENVMYLYGKSYDYGQVTAEDLNNADMRMSLEKMTIHFSTELDLELAKKNYVLIQNLDDESTN